MTAEKDIDQEDKQQQTSPAPPSKKMMVLAAGIILVLIAACGVGIYRYQTTSAASDKAAKVAAAKKSARPYTLTAPIGWQRVQPTPKGTTVAFADTQADTDPTGTLKAFVVVQSTELNAAAKKLSFDDVARSYVSQLSQGYENFMLVSSEAMDIAGSPAILTTFTFTQSKAEVTASSLFMVKQGISYAVNGESLTSAWPSHSAEVKQALISFRP